VELNFLYDKIFVAVRWNLLAMHFFYLASDYLGIPALNKQHPDHGDSVACCYHWLDEVVLWYIDFNVISTLLQQF